ncbi:MAG: hypothetical protein KJ709_06690 [Nanoarchaeota archaeon]|nr:hypothetical protein [Nanoarchaeota archaeon]
MLDVVLTKEVENAAAVAQKMGWQGVITKGFKAVNYDDKSRTLIERGQADCVYGFETVAWKDDVHHRNSGMNEVIAALMKKKHVAYGICFSMVLAAKGEKRAQILGRIMQNIDLARKANLDICLASFAQNPQGIRSPSDLGSFGISLGLKPEEAKKALYFAEERVNVNQKKKEKAYISPDLYLE